MAVLAGGKGFTGVDWYFRDTRKSAKQWMPIIVGRDSRTELLDFDGFFYLKTEDGAKRGRIVRVDPRHPEHEQWREIVPERKDAYLESFRIAGGKLLLQWNKDAATELQICELDGAGVRTVQLPEVGEASPMSGWPDQDEAFFRFRSYTRPPGIYSLSVRTAVARAWSNPDISGLDASAYVTERVFFASK